MLQLVLSVFSLVCSSIDLNQCVAVPVDPNWETSAADYDNKFSDAGWMI